MKRILVVALGCMAMLAAHGEYSLKVNNGKWPEGVAVENLNGNVPIANCYKNGWTDKGWTFGDYGTIRGVLLPPLSSLTERSVNLL